VALTSATLSVNQRHMWQERKDSKVNKYLGNGAFLKFKVLCLYCVSVGREDLAEK